LSVTYALLFLAAGAALLAVTYGLVANGLPRAAAGARFTSTQAAKLARACKQAEGSTTAGTVATTAAGGGASTPRSVVKPVPEPAPKSKPVPASCSKVFAAGADAAATSQRDQTLHNLLLFSLIGLGAMTLVSGGLGWVMAGRVLRPVRSITGAARRASERHLGERLALQGPRDELKELADTFDEMLDRLDASFASQRRFVADASHELRTPLTVMRTAIDVTLAKPSRSPEQLEAMAAKVRRSVDQAETLIDALLTLATSEQEASNREFVDLATAVEDALDAAEPGIAHLDLRVDANLEPAETTGDRLLLERLVANLVDNAVRHNVRGGWIRLRTGANGNGAHLEVANSGLEIPADVVQSLFEPFRRIEERTNARDGVGLGLAIVKSISAAHGASVEARHQPEGGLVISLAIPRDDGLDQPTASG
jgi:signal transduction histidine kinase